MSKLKIAGIIMAIISAATFVFLYCARLHTVSNAILVLLAGGFVVLGLLITEVADELEDTKDEK
ncbi:hypothetical protein [Eubacterium ramulus]|uniref:hypothetical protein n=1 Tax=Eubacterium ramulus TaxID=39490 RepID=UPI0022E0C6AA|nr:hypothetical protein [Eubacterium ramulus]